MAQNKGCVQIVIPHVVYIVLVCESKFEASHQFLRLYWMCLVSSNLLEVYWQDIDIFCYNSWLCYFIMWFILQVFLAWSWKYLIISLSLKVILLLPDILGYCEFVFLLLWTLFLTGWVWLSAATRSWNAAWWNSYAKLFCSNGSAGSTPWWSARGRSYSAIPAANATDAAAGWFENRFQLHYL